MVIERQLRPGDRVRVTFEAIVDEVGLGGMRVVLPDAPYFCQVPPGATVEVLNPPTLAERMAALADELEQSRGRHYDPIIEPVIRRIREELAVAGESPRRKPACEMNYSHGPFQPIVSCTLTADHDGPHNWADLLGVDR